MLHGCGLHMLTKQADIWEDGEILFVREATSLCHGIGGVLPFAQPTATKGVAGPAHVHQGALWPTRNQTILATLPRVEL